MTVLRKGEYVISPQALSRFAEAFVALASADDKKAQVSAALMRKALQALTEKHQKKIDSLWDEANKEALRLLVLVAQNNPLKSRDEILRRPDVRAVLRDPYLTAAKESEKVLRRAWEESEALTVKHTKGEFALWKQQWKGHTVDPALLESLVGDLHANAKAMRSRYREALGRDLSDPEKRLDVVARDSTRRARYSLQTAVWGVASQVRDSAYAAAGLNKVWLAVLDSKTCSHCAALHGMVIGPGEQFPKDAGASPLRTYKGTLFGPPRHPQCRCIIVGTKLQKSKKQI